MRRNLPIAILPMMLLLLHPPAEAATSQLEIQQQMWGFDGQILTEQFVPLSLLIVNVSDKPFDGRLTLTKDSGGGGRLGAKLVKRFYLPPGRARWVQFYPFAGIWDRDWTLSWGRGMNKQSRAVSQPATGPPACVILDDAGDFIDRSTKLTRFNDALLPACATAMDSLDVVVLDYVPQWDSPQRRAFVNWLSRGGKVCVIHKPAGGFPSFEGDLDLLNVPAGRKHVGAGVVVRHAATRREMSRDDLVDLGLAQPTEKEERGRNTAQYQRFSIQLLGMLKSMTRPKHNWLALFTLSVLYLALICPANWLVGRKKDYRLAMLMFLVCVAAFGGIFFALGKRGYGEATTVHTLSYVQPAAAGVHDVTQWGNVFVTTGNSYVITHDSEYNLYSAGLDFEAIPGVIQNGAGGRLLVDMPLYSSSQFLHRSEIAGDRLIDQVESFKADAKLDSLTLVCGAGFPRSPKRILAVYGDTAYPMIEADGRITLDASGCQSLTTLYGQQNHMYQYGRFGPTRLDQDEKPAETRNRLFGILTSQLIANKAGYRPQTGQSTPPPATGDIVHLFVVAETPTALNVSGDQFGQEFGRSVYHVKLLKPKGSEND